MRDPRAPRLVRQAIKLSRRYADAGNVAAARRWWGTACRLSDRCPGISGTCPAGGGYVGIVLTDGLVAISPVPLFDVGDRHAA